MLFSPVKKYPLKLVLTHLRRSGDEEEAEKTEWFKPKEPVQPPISTAKGSTKKTIKHEGPTPFVYSIDEGVTASVAEDLEKYAKREKIKQLQNITLKMPRGSYSDKRNKQYSDSGQIRKRM